MKKPLKIINKLFSIISILITSVGIGYIISISIRDVGAYKFIMGIIFYSLFICCLYRTKNIFGRIKQQIKEYDCANKKFT